MRAAVVGLLASAGRGALHAAAFVVLLTSVETVTRYPLMATGVSLLEVSICGAEYLGELDGALIYQSDTCLAPEVLGQTRGRVVVLAPDYTPGVLAHELVHVDQWSHYGSLPLALFYSMFGQLAESVGGDSYWDNVFELDAYAVQDALDG